ncbi:hypothetical protein C8J56DRAFT_244592 [Mycena floridula]|nr:hypothetical protein C8J56DRAFT_244592 [Mycena floridula]
MVITLCLYIQPAADFLSLLLLLHHCLAIIVNPGSRTKPIHSGRRLSLTLRNTGQEDENEKVKPDVESEKAKVDVESGNDNNHAMIGSHRYHRSRILNQHHFVHEFTPTSSQNPR